MNRPFMKIRFFTGGRPMVAPTGLRVIYRFCVTLSGGEPASRSRSFATQEQNRGAKRRRGLLTSFRIPSRGEPAERAVRPPHLIVGGDS